MVSPQIVMMDNFSGVHNSDLSVSDRLEKSKFYKDCSTICIVPTRGMIPAKVVQSWMGLMTPMNQKFIRLFIIGMEVGAAYNSAIEQILDNPELQHWKYILTLEEDNMPPPDALLKLIESIDNYGAIGGLYWTKGEGGQPMIYGDPNVMPKNFMPQIPIPDIVQECNGLGMGFTLFKLDMFKIVPKPWFKTEQSYIPGQGTKMFTQDLYFFENAAKHGFKFASDNRVKVGHYDVNQDIIW